MRASRGWSGPGSSGHNGRERGRRKNPHPFRQESKGWGAWRIEGRPDAWWAGFHFFWKVATVTLRKWLLWFGSVGELRDDAELLHKAQSVPVDKAFRYLAGSRRERRSPRRLVMCFRLEQCIEVTFMGAPAGQRVMTVSPSAMTSSIVK